MNQLYQLRPYENWEEAELAAEIQGAVAAGDAGRLRACIDDAANCCFKERPRFGPQGFSELIFELILTMLKRPEFLEMEGSHYLLKLFEYDWGLLSEPQKARLVPALEEAWPNFKDWLSRFIISELLGEYSADEWAFEALRRLRRLKPDDARVLVPHGFEHIVRDSSDKDLSKKAFAELLEMRDDQSEDVRGEVMLSLQRLANLGYRAENSSP